MNINSETADRILAEANDFLKFPAKIASLPNPTDEELNSLNRDWFADPQNRAFPLHTKVATFASNLIYRALGGDNPEILERLNLAAVQHGIESDIKRYDDFIARKCASLCSSKPSIKFALTLERKLPDGKMQKIAAYPMQEFQLEESARSALRDFQEGRLPFLHFAKVARRIYAEAQEQNVKLPSAFSEIAEAKLFDAEATSYLIPENAGEFRRDYEEIIKTASQTERPEEQDLLAEAWYTLDTHLGVKRSCMPHSILWSGPSVRFVDKMASEMIPVDLGHGKPTFVPMQAVANVNLEKARPLLRNQEFEVLSSMHKLANEARPLEAHKMFASQPNKTQRVIVRALAEATA